MSDFFKLKKGTPAVVRSSYIRTLIFFSCSFFRFLSMLIRAILLANLTIMGLGPGLLVGSRWALDISEVAIVISVFFARSRTFVSVASFCSYSVSHSIPTSRKLSRRLFFEDFRFPLHSQRGFISLTYVHLFLNLRCE